MLAVLQVFLSMHLPALPAEGLQQGWFVHLWSRSGFTWLPMLHGLPATAAVAGATCIATFSTAAALDDSFAACATCLQPHWLLPVESTVLTTVLTTVLATVLTKVLATELIVVLATVLAKVLATELTTDRLQMTNQPLAQLECRHYIVCRSRDFEEQNTF